MCTDRKSVTYTLSSLNADRARLLAENERLRSALVDLRAETEPKAHKRTGSQVTTPGSCVWCRAEYALKHTDNRSDT